MISGNMQLYAIVFFDNVGRTDGEGVSPWMRTHGSDFSGMLIPFGSKVYFKSSTDRIHKQQFEDLAIVGILAGYETSLGCGWSGTYLVWGLEGFMGIDLHQKLNAINRRHIMPHLMK